MISGLKETLQQAIGNTPGAQIDVILTILVVTALWLARRILLRVALRKTDNVHARYRWRKTSAYLAFLVGAVLIIGFWFQGLGSLSTMIGLVSAGVVIGLKDPLVNLAGWVFIVWRQPFSVGDRIQIGDVCGDVIDLRIFQFTLMEVGNWVQADQSTGRILHVPNGRVFTETTANYSRGFQYIWDEIGVLLTLRYLTEPQKRRGRLEAIWEDILRAFAEHDDIDFAYPTQRFYVNSHEGKPGTVKAPPVTEQPRDPLGV